MAGFEEQLEEALGVEGAQPQAVGGVLASTRADDYVNNPMVEQMWAVQAFKYAEVHFKLIQSKDAKDLKLTKVDDELCERFESVFKDMKVDVIDVDDLKSPNAKQLWREFCNGFAGKVHDFNLATLLRIDCSKEYNEQNTVLVPRAQFLAVEVVRNRRDYNSIHYNKPTDDPS